MFKKQSQASDAIHVAFRERFETVLAVSLLESPTLLETVDIVNQFILEMIQNRREAVVECIENSSNIHRELFSKTMFGHLSLDETQPNLPEDIADRLIQLLESDSTSLPTTLLIHSVFTHRLFDAVITDEKTLLRKQNTVKQLFFNPLFSDRGREAVDVAEQITHKSGISRCGFFSKKSPNLTPHFPAMNKFKAKAKTNTDYYKKVIKHKLPFVAGPSGHTGSHMILGVLSNLSNKQLQHYALACFAYLTAGGNHSFDEVLVVANKVGVPYQAGQYKKSIPKSIREEIGMNKLIKTTSLHLPEITELKTMRI